LLVGMGSEQRAVASILCMRENRTVT
jgi:hypothetical protein